MIEAIEVSSVVFSEWSCGGKISMVHILGDTCWHVFLFGLRAHKL